MTDTTSNNILNIHPPAENKPSQDDLRLLSVKQNNCKAGYGELALLSKRKARTELRIGNDTLNKLIENGQIKTILINDKEKIPYISLLDYIYKMSLRKESKVKKDYFTSEEKSIAMANNIIQEINNGG